MRIKTFYIFNSFLIIALTIATATWLIMSTSYLHESAEEIEKTSQIFIILTQTRDRIIDTTTLSYELFITKDLKNIDRIRVATKELTELSHDLRAMTWTKEGSQIAKEVDDSIHQFIGTLNQETKNIQNHVQLHKKFTEAMYTVLNTLSKLRTYKHEQNKILHNKMERMNLISDTFGVVAIILFIIMITSLLFVGIKYLYNPLIKISRSIANFELGPNIKKVEEHGLGELKDMAKRFNEMAQRLADQREIQLRFLSAVAHDIKGPLNAIRMTMDFMQESKDIENNKKILAMSVAQIKKLNRMISDLMDMTVIETGKLNIRKENFDLREIIKTSIAIHESTTEIHKFILSIPENPVITEVDPIRIEQVINNIINNAIKYSPNGGEIKISLTENNKQKIITIQDHGIGIDKDEIQNIFIPFRRTLQTKDTIPGVGLGLSTSKHIMEAHNGKIELKSTKGEGSIFTLIFNSAG